MVRFLYQVPSLFLLSLTTAVFAESAEPMAYWSFDESGGDAVRDETGNGNTGTIVGDVERTEGLSGRALSFNGEKSSYVDIAKTEALDIRDALTIEAWINRTDTGTMWDGLVCNGNSNKGYQLFYGEAGQNLTFYINTDESGYGATGGGYVPMKEWMHIVAVFDSEEEQVRLYQNGRQTGSRHYNGRITDFPEEFYLGRAINFNAYRGLMDEVKIYDEALGAEQVTARYEEYAAQLPPPSSEPVPAFQDLSARLDGNEVKVTFTKTDEYLATADGKTTKTHVQVYRNSHRRNDTNPGVSGGELVFEGELSSSDNRHYTYIGERPEEDGRSYYYWVTPDGKNFRAKPAKLRIYHEDIWWSVDKINHRLDRLAEKYPEKVRIETIGTSVEGRPFRALFAGNPERRIVLVGAVHVAESGPELILGAVERLLEKNPDLLEEVGIAALPCSSLDRRHHLLSSGYPRYLRRNANGVDINRNFPAYWNEVATRGSDSTDDPESQTYRGEEPASEPETRAIMKLLEKSNPLAVFSFHSIASLTNAGFLFSRYAVQEEDEDYIERANAVANAYAQGMYPEKWEEYYFVRGTGSPGALPSWSYKEYGVPAYDLELDNNPKPREVVYGDAVSPEMMREFQERHRAAIANVMRLVIERKLGE